MTDDIAQQILQKLNNLEEGQTELRGDVRRLEILLEDTDSRLDATLEVVSSMRDSVLRIPQMADDIANLKVDNKLIKMTVKATNQDLKDQNRRVTHLETITHV